MRARLVIVILLFGLDPAAALERADRLALRYSNQVVFDRRGEPLVSVRLTESQRSVTFTSEGRLVLLPGADDDGRVVVPAGSEWSVTVEAGAPGRVQHWVVVAQFFAPTMAEVAAERARWVAAGHVVEVLEGGAVIGLSGRTLDTRVLTVVIDPKPTAAAARAAARAIAAEHDLPPRTVEALVDKPTGWVVAREKRSGVEVRGHDLLWATTEPDRALVFPRLVWGQGTPKRGTAKRSYTGDVYFTVGNDGRLAVVNVLPAERIIEGVVPSEIPRTAPPAALEAQAIAARGQLLTKVGTRHRADPYLLCAETHCQAYTGETRRDPRTTAAVAATRGLLLFDAEGLVDTVYSSTCGGRGEASDQMWQGPPRATLAGGLDSPGRTPVPLDEADVPAFIDAPPGDAWCHDAPRFRWHVERSAQQVTDAVKAARDVGPVRAIVPLRRGHSGRVLAVRYEGARGAYVLKGAYKNRTLLGGLPSGLWIATPTGPADAPTGWDFRGGGFGHGVGMCQYGAIGMAKAGVGRDAILRHYYPGSRLEAAW